MGKSEPWIDIVGIGEDGMAGLTPTARQVVENAEVIIGGDRHHRLSDDIRAERLSWPHPFDALIDTIRELRGRRLVILATGDPLWFSVGARIVRALGPEAIRFHPGISAFQHAACRLGWSLADCETLTAHGRPVEQLVPRFWPGARLIILTTGGETPGQVARLLTARGFGPSRMTVFAALGGANEQRFDGVAESWAQLVPDFNTLAVECVAEPSARLLSPLPGLPDDAFVHDGQLTKREVRAATLSALMPARGELLWDIGAGCGSVGIEWMRAAPDALAIAIEPDAARRALVVENARTLGAPRLRLVEGRAPEALAGLPQPNAVFIGGGLARATFDAAHAALAPFGRLVVNAVSLESEALLAALQAEHGGELVRIAVSRAAPVGRRRGWKPLMQVTQYRLVKR
ncbi:MAG: precorrin-6y C5,15-methyltransferase (decarboxylating) subunit CbiE [Alphaproteobacteria bacterium]|nr:MAG: precorrin-6y C5,15-methyltransferase (decarboxylating) subunit CbiE [Alphaproteobacteria bacterium]